MPGSLKISDRLNGSASLSFGSIFKFKSGMNKVKSKANTKNCIIVLITTTTNTRDKSPRASRMLLTIARIPRTPSTIKTGCAIEVSNNPTSHSDTNRILKGKASLSPITPVMKSRYCRIATWIAPRNRCERNARKIPSDGK